MGSVSLCWEAEIVQIYRAPYEKLQPDTKIEFQSIVNNNPQPQKTVESKHFVISLNFPAALFSIT